MCLCALHCSHINLFFIYFSFIHYFTRINKYKVIKFLIFVIHIWEIFNICRCSCYSTLRSSTCVTLLAHFIIVLYINYKWKFVQGNKKGIIIAFWWHHCRMMINKEIKRHCNRLNINEGIILLNFMTDQICVKIKEFVNIFFHDDTHHTK